MFCANNNVHVNEVTRIASLHAGRRIIAHGLAMPRLTRKRREEVVQQVYSRVPEVRQDLSLAVGACHETYPGQLINLDLENLTLT